MLNSELFSFKNPKFFNYHKNFKSFAIIIAFFFFLSTIFLSGMAHAAERQLVFDPSPDNRVEGYFLYWGESENFGTVVKLEGKENTSHFLEGLEVGTTYYFAARAYDAYDNESVLSDVLVYTVDVCTVHYSLNLGVGPPGSGTINKEPDLEFYSSDSEVSLVATAASGYEFSHWSGDLSGSENPATVIMNGDKNVMANFAAIVETVSTPSVPEGSTSGTVGLNYAYSTGGSLSNLGNPVEYRFDWGDGTYSHWTEPHNVSKAWSSAGNYLIKAQARSVSDTSVESDWSDSLSVTISPELVKHTVDTNPSGLKIVVNGVSYTAPEIFEWEAGTSHTLSVPSPQSVTADERFVYSSWSNGGSQTHTITAESSPTTYTGSFTVQYSLTTFGSSSGGGTVSPSGENWYDKGESLLIMATAASGYEFSHWSGGVNGSENPANVTMNSSKSVTAHFSYNEPSFMEMGEAIVNGNRYDQKNWIPFTQTFTRPVVVAKPASLNDPDPAVVRIEVGEEGFYIWIQNWEYLNRIHDYETVSYLVIEEGSYVLPGEIMFEAGTFEADGSQFTEKKFRENFNHVPVVIASVTSINEANAVTGRIRNVTSGGFEYLLQQQGRNSRGPRAKSHGTEKVSFIACEPFSGNLNAITIEVGTTGNQVGNDFYYLTYTETFEKVPYFLADMQTANEMDTANVRYRDKKHSGVEIQISEEQSQNAEVNHEYENVGYFIISD